MPGHAAPIAQRPLVIGIDARAATESQAGRGRVVRELVRALAVRPGPHRYLCFARERWNEPLDPRFEWKLSGARDPLWHVETAREASKRCDVFLSTNSYLTVMLTRAPSVAIIHDLLVFEAGMSPNRRSAVIEHLTLGAAVRRSTGLVCVSQATADALLTRFPRARAKVSVAPLAVAPVLAIPGPEQLGSLPAPGFVLAVGTLEPRKNLPRLVSAYQALPTALQSAHPLVVVGPRGWRTGATMAALQSLGDRCVLLGHVSDEVLAELYRRCAVFCYPSLGEGFGLPVLEAMGVGAAVITSNLSSLPEVGGDAVAYVDPRDVDAIARGLTRMLSDGGLRARLGRAAVDRSREFSWDRFAGQVEIALERAAGAGDQPSSAS